MNQTDMLHQMCHEVLAEADIRAICKTRGLPSQVATSRPMLQSLFLSDAGVAVAMRSLDPVEIALLYLLRLQDRPVDVAFFTRLNPPRTEDWSYGTYSQRFGGLFTRVKDRMVRPGVLLLALGPETATTKAKMERWLFALPVQFARHLPPLAESASLPGEGDWRSDAGREKLKSAIHHKADREPKSERLEIVADELRWGGQPFQSDHLVQWRKLQWQGETAPPKQRQAERYNLPPDQAVLSILAGLDAGRWCPVDALALPLEVFCGIAVDAASVCDSGWRWGFLARQEVEGRMWYRAAPTALVEVPPDRYLTVSDDGVVIDLDVVPFDALESLVRMSDQRALPGGRPALLLTPNLLKLGRAVDTVALPLADWLQKNAPAFQQALETVRKRHGKTILHENLSIARVSDLSLKVALQKALSGRIVSLGDEHIAFPTGAVAEVKRLVAQMGHVVKEMNPHAD